MVPRSDAGHGRADGLDDARALVAEDAGEGEGQPAARHAEVRVTQSGRHHADDCLVRSGFGEFDVREDEGCSAGLDDGGAGGDGHRTNS